MMKTTIANNRLSTVILERESIYPRYKIPKKVKQLYHLVIILGIIYIFSKVIAWMQWIGIHIKKS